jgi:uncharacterized protein YecT (DUF1311 family)
MSIRVPPCAAVVALAGLFCQPPSAAVALQDDAAAVRACVAKYPDDVEQAERHCVFVIVADLCTALPANQSTMATAECYSRETRIWDAILNDNFRALRDDLDDGQKAKLRDMQRAWIADRDATCGFYHDKIRGTLATTMAAACVGRETARRALLLKQFQGL